jgi:hypothetical protein
MSDVRTRRKTYKTVAEPIEILRTMFGTTYNELLWQTID